MNNYLKGSAAFILIILFVHCLGCSNRIRTGTIYSSQSYAAVSWSADLDDYRVVHLVDAHHLTYSSIEPKREVKQLILKISPKNQSYVKRILKAFPLNIKGAMHELLCEEIELRTDQERKKVWFVYKPLNHVIATVDITTGSTTGPEDPPPGWATLDGGFLLKTKCESSASDPPPPSWALP